MVVKICKIGFLVWENLWYCVCWIGVNGGIILLLIDSNNRWFFGTSGEVLMTKDEWYRQLFERLDNSRFRSSFHLKQKDIDYINEKGLDTIRQHAKDFIAKREAPAYIANDGKQTPMKGLTRSSGSWLWADRSEEETIRYLSLSMQQLHAAESASESGIKCSRARN